MMSAKQFTLSLVAIIVASVIAIMSINYFVDPYKYFAAQQGDDYSMDEGDYLREQKAEHIRYFHEQYDAYLIGGSKGGAVRPSKLKEMDGYNYYNCWVLSGNFPDYLAYVKYIVENTDAKKILFQISSSELYDFNRTEKGTIYETPAILSGESKFKEMVKFLMKNPKVAWEELTQKSGKSPCYESGERNLNHYYKSMKKNPQTYCEQTLSEAEKYYEYFDADLESLTNNKNKCITMLKEIKSLCDEHEVELQVYFASLFMPQMVQYECEDYYDFMEEVVMICDNGEGVWNFNTYNDLALCPYNYYNPNHFFYEVADLMIDTMSGKECEIQGFGELLTRENIGKVINRRRKSFEELKAYYKKNGTLPFKGYDSEFNITFTNS